MAKYKIHKLNDKDIEILNVKGINTSILESGNVYCLVADKKSKNDKHKAVIEDGNLVVFELDFKVGKKGSVPMFRDYAKGVIAASVFAAAGYAVKKPDYDYITKKKKEELKLDDVSGFRVLLLPEEEKENLQNAGKKIVSKLMKACGLGEQVFTKKKEEEFFQYEVLPVDGFRSGNQSIAELSELADAASRTAEETSEFEDFLEEEEIEEDSEEEMNEDDYEDDEDYDEDEDEYEDEIF